MYKQIGLVDLVAAIQKVVRERALFILFRLQGNDHHHRKRCIVMYSL